MKEFMKTVFIVGLYLLIFTPMLMVTLVVFSNLYYSLTHRQIVEVKVNNEIVYTGPRYTVGLTDRSVTTYKNWLFGVMDKTFTSDNLQVKTIDTEK